MIINVLMYEISKGDEGIHSIEVNGKTIVLMFEDKDDAERYCGLLEAQDFPKPFIEAIERTEIEGFCSSSGYETRFVPKGFIPDSEEERLFLTPPERNLDVSIWEEDERTKKDKLIDSEKSSIEIDSFRKRLEDLI